MRSVRIAAVGLAGMAAAISATAADATTIIYTLTGTFSGSTDTMGDFTDVVGTLTAYGDTDQLGGNTVGTRYVAITSATVSGAGYTGAFASTGKEFFAINNGWEGAGFGQDTVRFSFTSPVLATYDGISDLAPTAVDFLASAPFTTSLGTITLSSESNLTFSAHVSDVPEPGIWATMIAGFGLVGGSFRIRRRRVAFA